MAGPAYGSANEDLKLNRDSYWCTAGYQCPCSGWWVPANGASLWAAATPMAERTIMYMPTSRKGHFVILTIRRLVSLLTCLATPVIWMAPFLTTAAWGETILIPAKEMTGIGEWKECEAWGAGNYFTSDGSPVSKRVELEGGEYNVYLRLFTSHTTPGDIRVSLNGRFLVAPMQAKVHKLGWVRLGSVVLPGGPLDIRVEPPVPGQASGHNFAALALSSTRLDDRVSRIMAFSRWLRDELIRLERPKPAPRSATEAQQRRQLMRCQLLRNLGLDPLPARTPLRPQILGRIDKDDYSIEKIAYESRPNHVVPALLYLPKHASGPVPGVISAIGHWKYGKSSKAPQLRGIGLVKQGYAVLALDPVYAWERGIPGNNEGFEPLVAGGCIAGHEVWDIMRGVDYLETRAEIDSSRLAVTGASGGGLQTFYSGAVDERFDAVLPAVALWPMSELAVNGYYSADNWVPGISHMGGMGCLIKVIAPRPLLVMNVDADYATSYACEQLVDAARPFYGLLGSDSCIQQTIEKGPHDYTRLMREASCAFLNRWLKGVGDGFPREEPSLEKDLFDEQDPALWVFAAGEIPREGAETVQSFWRAQAASLRAVLPDNPVGLPGKMRELVRMPSVVSSPMIPTDGGFLLTTDASLQVAVRRVGKGTRAVIWLGASDCDSEAQRAEVQSLARHATVFVVEPRGAGMKNEMHILRHATIVMGRPLSGMWAYDLLCTVDAISRNREFESIRVAGCGREMGLACLLATLLDDRIEAVAVDKMFSSFVQLVGYQNPASQIPGILRVTDVEQLVRAVGPNRVSINNLEESEWGRSLSSSFKPSARFFAEWIRLGTDGKTDATEEH